MKTFFKLLLLFVVVAISVINFRLYMKPDVLHELRDLKEAIDNGADLEMQKMYPEGYVFMNATYALAWSSFGKNNKKYSDEGRGEIDKAWTKINNDHSLPPGSFYNGWNTYVLGLKIEAGDKLHLDQFMQQCDSMAGSLTKTTFPESYPGAAWPADVTVCVASLSMHDHLFKPKYREVIAKWINDVKSATDKHGMIPHSLNETARGSSMALILIFLKDIDRNFAEEQFKLFKESFVDSKLGITGIREYPKGESGKGDIDSGPVILGFGGASTLVGMQTLTVYGEEHSGSRVSHAVDAIVPSGLLPIADSFRTWSHTAMPIDEPVIIFTGFHLYSTLFGSLLIFLIRKLR